MLKINLGNLKTYAQELGMLLDKYEENAMTIAKEMQDGEMNWHDDNTEEFFVNITKQKEELKEFLVSLKKVDTSYDDIIKKIDKIKSNMKTIFVDDSKKSTIKTAYDTAIKNLLSIRNRLNGLSIYFCTYYEKSLIRSEISRMGSAAQSLENAMNNIDTLFSKFAALETEINNTMSKISINTISSIDFSEYV